MENAAKYMEGRPTWLIEHLIRNHCSGDMALHMDTVAAACAELAKRKGNGRDPYGELRLLFQSYLE